MKWYAIQAYSGYENKVHESLVERFRRANLGDQLGEILIPKEKVEETRDGKKRVTTRAFYPGYIFVQMNLSDMTWHLIKDVPKVSGFLGGRTPTPVPQREIDIIAQQVAEGSAQPRVHVEFKKDDHVRITHGSFANYTGTIQEVNPNKQLVTVLVSMFGRSNAVEFKYGHVEKSLR